MLERVNSSCGCKQVRGVSNWRQMATFFKPQRDGIQSFGEYKWKMSRDAWGRFARRRRPYGACRSVGEEEPGRGGIMMIGHRHLCSPLHPAPASAPSSLSASATRLYNLSIRGAPHHISIYTGEHTPTGECPVQNCSHKHRYATSFSAHFLVRLCAVCVRCCACAVFSFRFVESC